MNNQKLVSNALSTEQTNHVKGGNPAAVIGAITVGYEVGKWSYDHRRQIASAAKTTYKVSKKVVNFVKSWF